MRRRRNPKKVGRQQSDSECVYKRAERLAVTFFGKGGARQQADVFLQRKTEQSELCSDVEKPNGLDAKVLSEIFCLRKMWNNLLRKLWNIKLTLYVKWNKSTHAHRHFTRHWRISRTECISQIPQGIYFAEKTTCLCKSFFLAGAEGLEPSARGFGDTVSFRKSFIFSPRLAVCW